MQCIMAAIPVLATRFGIEDHAEALQRVSGRDRDVVAMKRLEVVADFLEAIEVATRNAGQTLSPAVRERLLAIKGLGPVRVDEILAALNVEAGSATAGG